MPNLLFTSAHCRDPSIRQRVISLLQRYPRLESVIDGHTASRLARRIAEIEKQDLSLPMYTSDVVPEADRIRMLSLSFYRSENRLVSDGMMHDTEPGYVSCDRDGHYAFTTRIRFSFLRCLPITGQISIEEDWIDDTGTSLTVCSNSASVFATRLNSTKRGASILRRFIFPFHHSEYEISSIPMPKLPLSYLH
jgi:hypothetical protein